MCYFTSLQYETEKKKQSLHTIYYLRVVYSRSNTLYIFSRSKQRLEMTTVDKIGKGNPRISLCVVDLHPDVTNAELFDAFTTAGPIRWICVCRDKITKLSLGYGFVKFEKKVDGKISRVLCFELYVLGKQFLYRF